MNTLKNETKRQQQDTVDVLLRTYTESLKDSTNETAISMSYDSRSFFQNDLSKFNSVLNELHETFEIGRKYREEKVFEAFPTLGDAYEYLAIQTLINDGIIDTSGL